MKSRIADLRCKEIINVTDGSRYGYVGDVEVDLDSGRVCALVVPGRLRLFGLLGREADRIFPWIGAAVWGGHHPGGVRRAAVRPRGTPPGQTGGTGKNPVKSAFYEIKMEIILAFPTAL